MVDLITDQIQQMLLLSGTNPIIKTKFRTTNIVRTLKFDDRQICFGDCIEYFKSIGENIKKDAGMEALTLKFGQKMTLHIFKNMSINFLSNKSGQEFNEWYCQVFKNHLHWLSKTNCEIKLE